MEDDSFEIEFCGDHVRVKLGRDYDASPEESGKFWAAVEKICKDNHCARVLVEGHVPKRKLETRELIDKGLKTAEFVPKLWLALCLHDNQDDEAAELFKTVARTGGVHVKFFTDTTKALQWLRENG